MKEHSTYLISKKESALKNGSITPEMFEFYHKLFLMQEEFIKDLDSPGASLFKIGNSDLPAFKADLLEFNDALTGRLAKLLGDIIELIKKDNSGLDFDRLAEGFTRFAGEVFAQLLNRDFEGLEKQASACKIDLDEFIFLIHNVFKPLMVFLRKSSGFKLESDEDWLENHCPFCGYLPGMGKIVGSKDNQRILSCALCENEWKFVRVTCTFCGNSEQKEQGYFEFTENPVYRVYYCNQCKSYIKSINLPKSMEDGGFDLHVEDILTTYLDSSMLGKGYFRP
jgi:formate dehydrogenase maturation protein FdhE